LLSSLVIPTWYLSWDLLIVLLFIKIEECGLSFFFIFFLILFSFQFIFHFPIFRTLELGLEVISHISHIWWCGYNINHRTWEKGVEGSGTKWHHTTWTPHVGLTLNTCVVATTYHKGQMISLTSKPQSRSIMWDFTRELDKEPLLN